MARGSDHEVAVCSTCRSIFVARLTEDGDYQIIGIDQSCPSCENENFEIITVDRAIEGTE